MSSPWTVPVSNIVTTCARNTTTTTTTATSTSTSNPHPIMQCQLTPHLQVVAKVALWQHQLLLGCCQK
jgi:hypothetical protein